MKRETYGLMAGAIFVAIILMTTNDAIGDSKLSAALVNAKPIKVEHQALPINNAFPVEEKIKIEDNIKTEINQRMDGTQEIRTKLNSNLTGNSNIYLERNFGINTKDLNTDEILKLQLFLINNNFLAEKYLTGEFGSITKQAVVDFQNANNISPATGFVGDLTRELINRTY